MTQIAYPFRFDSRGRTAAADEDAHLRQLIEQLLFTAPGERVMRPDFGAGLRALVFEPMTATTRSLVEHTVERALVEWEPRIDVLQVRASFDQDDPSRGRLLVDIQYRVRATNSFYNLVYPFYLLEGTPT